MSQRIWKQWQLCGSETLVEFLQEQAEGRMRDMGHPLSARWTTAKRHMGKGASRMTCPTCRTVAYVLPYGQHGLRVGMGMAPAITGDALQRRCGQP